MQGNSVKIRGIGSEHDSTEYIVLDFYLPGQLDGRQVQVHFKGEVHIVNSLPAAKILVGLDILGP